MRKLAIYPGSFDPLTNGHLDLIQRASKLFDAVIVAVAKDTQKNLLFTTEERVGMVKEATKDLKEVTVESFSGLIIEFARQKKARVLIRGLRMISDFEYEFQMALTNRRLAEEIETVFLMPSEGHQFISSSIFKEAGLLGADISSFAPDHVVKKVREKAKRRRKS